MANDAQRTTRWAFDMRTSTLATNTTLGTATRHDFAAQTIYVPETSRSFAKANGGRVMVRVSALQSGNTATDLDGVRIGIKINAVAFDDLDVTVALAHTGNTWRLEMTRDVTDYFSTNDPGTASFTCQVGVAVASGIASSVTAITAELVTTYAYDSTASTWADTAMFPIQSGLTSPPSSAGGSWTEMGVDGTGGAPTNQIRKLTGSGGAFESVTGFTLRKRFLVVMANYNSITVSFPVALRYQIDGAGATALSCFGGNIGGAGTSNRVYAIVDITALSVSAAHKLEWSMDIVAGFEHLGCLDVVTYEYTKPGSGDVCFVSLQLPLVNVTGDNTGAVPARTASAADADRWSATFDVQEVAPAIDQSGVVIWDGFFGGGSDTLLAATGQTERQYDRSTVSARDSWNAVVQRCDHSSSTWAVARGRNVLSVDIRTNTVYTGICESAGIAYVNYRCTRHPGGAHKHNRTILAAQLLAYTESANTTTTPDEPVIVPTDYVLSGAYVEQLTWGPQAAVVLGVGAQRQSAEDSGKGWYRSSYTGSVNIAEIGACPFPHPVSRWFRSRSGLADGADIEVERKWHAHASTATTAHQLYLYATLHSCTFTVAGTVTVNTVAVANGKTVKIWALDASNRVEYIGSTTTAGGAGAYSFTTAPDSARTYFATYVDGSNIGRSADGTAGTSTFDIGIGAAATPDVIITATPAVSTTATGATFTFTVAPGAAEYSVDGGAYSAAVSPIVLAGLALGAHFIIIRSTTDTSHSQRFDWTVASAVAGDTTPPTITIVSPTPGVVPGGFGGFSADWNVARLTPIIIDITDVTPGNRYQAIVCQYPGAQDELVVYRRGAFRGQWAALSSESVIANGKRLTILPSGGWTSFDALNDISFEVDALDQAGNLAS